MKSSSRNLGIDILRIASMVAVVFLHVLGHGGILNMAHSPASFFMVWFFEILAYPAVNCFVLISGYVGYKGENIFPKIRNILSLMTTVVFYSVLLFLIFAVLGPETFGLQDLSKSFFPTIFKNYWFFSAYFGLFLLSPILNLIVYKSNSKHAFTFLIVFFLICVISVVYDTFTLRSGYSLIWLIFMYLVGAIIKKYDLTKLFYRKTWLTIALVSFAVTWLSKIVLCFTNISLLEKASGLLVKYVSPTIVLMAIGFLCWFSKMKCSPSLAPVVSFFSLSAFSVYLIHENIFVRSSLVSKIHTLIGDFNFVLLTLSIVFFALMIFLVCILIDKLRIMLFKVIKIDKLIIKIESLVKTILNTAYIKFEKALHSPKE